MATSSSTSSRSTADDQWRHQIDTELSDLKSDVSGIKVRIDGFGRQLQELIELQRTRSNPNFPFILSLMVAFGTLLAGLGAGIIAYNQGQLAPVRTEVSYMEDAVRELKYKRDSDHDRMFQIEQNVAVALTKATEAEHELDMKWPYFLQGLEDRGELNERLRWLERQMREGEVPGP